MSSNTSLLIFGVLPCSLICIPVTSSWINLPPLFSSLSPCLYFLCFSCVPVRRLQRHGDSWHPFTLFPAALPPPDVFLFPTSSVCFARCNLEAKNNAGVLLNDDCPHVNEHKHTGTDALFGSFSPQILTRVIYTGWKAKGTNTWCLKVE